MMDEMIHQYQEPTSSPLADKLVDFVFHYENGLLAPDRWDYYEPVRRKVDNNTPDLLKGIISKPCMIEMKRQKSPRIGISVWNEEYPDISPSVLLLDRSSRTSITIYPDRHRSFKLSEWTRLLRDFCQEMETDYGYISDLETHELFAHVFSVPYHERVNRNWKEILGARRMVEAVQSIENSTYSTLGWSTSRFFPAIEMRENWTTLGDPSLSILKRENWIEMGHYSLALLKDTLSVENTSGIHFGLRLDLDRRIKNVKDIEWDNPDYYDGSYLFLSRHDLLESFKTFKDDIVIPLPKVTARLFENFGRIYYKEDLKDKRSRSILLLSQE